MPQSPRGPKSVRGQQPRTTSGAAGRALPRTQPAPLCRSCWRSFPCATADIPQGGAAAGRRGLAGGGDGAQQVGPRHALRQVPRCAGLCGWVDGWVETAGLRCTLPGPQPGRSGLQGADGVKERGLAFLSRARSCRGCLFLKRFSLSHCQKLHAPCRPLPGTPEQYFFPADLVSQRVGAAPGVGTLGCPPQAGHMSCLLRTLLGRHAGVKV